jgi:radical SAM superfamily enzyme YgiQ (UPF0313 family)
MRLRLINPANPLVSMTKPGRQGWNRFRVWKPLGLLVIAGMTPPPWEVEIIDKNLGIPDYTLLPRPDLVGITAFTSQAPRAYDLAAMHRAQGVPVVIGGIHASMRPDEAATFVDTVVTGEAEGVWPELLADAAAGRLRPRYDGRTADLASVPPPRHDLLAGAYAFGAIQTTRGCPLNCSFCSVSAFNGTRYRQRPVDSVVEEFRLIRESRVLVVDDNLIGTRSEHIARAKELFRALAAARLGKHWIAQVTINLADDDELMSLARAAGCIGVFIGFEAVGAEGLREIGKLFNLKGGRDLAASVRRIQRHRIMVVGSFIIGLDADRPGIGERIAATAQDYGVDILNVLFLTPLPGTRLWDEAVADDRLTVCDFPSDWRYFTLGFPVVRYAHLTASQAMDEMAACDRRFYGLWPVLRRLCAGLATWRWPLVCLLASLSYRGNAGRDHRAHAAFLRTTRQEREPRAATAQA